MLVDLLRILNGSNAHERTRNRTDPEAAINPNRNSDAWH
jgi:hypothetical protein